MHCSKCTEPAKHHITIRREHPEPEPGKRDKRGLRIIRFCEEHWTELTQLLPRVA